MDQAERNSTALEASPTAPKTAEPKGRERREDERYEFRRNGVQISIEHPGGGLTKISAFLRNLSAGGLAFLSRGYIHPGSNCNLTLMRKDGRGVVVKGKVTNCRYILDSAHEVGLKLDKRIEPGMLLDVSGSDGPDVGLRDLKGRVLMVDDSPMDQILFTHHMKASGVEIRFANALEEACKLIGEETFDVVICNPDLGGGRRAGAIYTIRSKGYTGPIVACTAEDTAERITAARNAGAAHVLLKPYGEKELHDLFTSLHRQAGAVLTARSIFSTLDDDTSLEFGLAQFVTFARQCAEQIDAASRKSDLAAVRAVCLSLKGSSAGFGFASLGEAAREAMESLDMEGATMESSWALARYVCLMCKSVALRNRHE